MNAAAGSRVAGSYRRRALTGSQHAEIVRIDNWALRAEGTGTVVIFARRVSASQWSVTIRAIGELDGCFCSVADRELARVGIIHYHCVAATTMAW